MNPPVLVLFVAITCLGACTPKPIQTKFDFWSKDRTSGLFFDGDKLAVGSVQYENGRVFDKGVESKQILTRTETPHTTCLSGDRFTMALPKASGILRGQVRCGAADFVISPCANGACSGSLVKFSDQIQARGSPRWYSYSVEGGVTKISYDPRGLSFNTMFLEGVNGPKATGE